MGRTEVVGLLVGAFVVLAVMATVFALGRAHARRKERNGQAWAALGSRMALAPIADGAGVRGRVEGVDLSAWYAEGEVVIRALLPDPRDHVDAPLLALASRIHVAGAQVALVEEELTVRWAGLEVDAQHVERAMRAVAACCRDLERGYRG